jgi:RNA polymerase sigma-70 factor (ECF subfamily)
MGEGDTAALGVLLERYWPSTVRYATGILGSRDDAEDVAQQTFERLWERRDAWQVEESALPLILRLTRNRSLDQLRRRAARERANANFPPPRSPLTPEAILEQRELRALVTKTVDSLPERRREVLLLARMQGLTRNEIAEVMDISPQTVANHLQLAMDDVRRLLAPCLYEMRLDSEPVRADASA